MSKKTRKKSSKPTPRKAVGAKSATSAKKPISKARQPAAGKASKKTSKQTEGNSSKVSHKAASKPLKSQVPAKSASSKAPARKPEPAVAPTGPKPLAKPAAAKPPVAKTDPSTPAGSTLTEGAKAPDFRLPRDGGSTVSLSDFSGKKLVLFFYPRADTPGCTKEAIDFTRLAGAFADIQTAVLGVSADALKAQEAFRDKHQLSMPLVSDERHEMLEAYGVWGEKSMYGKTFNGILRTTVLIGVNGRIIRIWRHVKVDGHADEVLAAARAA